MPLVVRAARQLSEFRQHQVLSQDLSRDAQFLGHCGLQKGENGTDERLVDGGLPATLKSHARLSSNPPPSVGPPIAAIVA